MILLAISPACALEWLVHPATPHTYTVMKTILSLLLLASCSSLPQEEIEALVAFREGEISRLNEHSSILLADVERLEAEILNIEAQIVTLQDQRTQTIHAKAEVHVAVEATKVLIEENAERLDDLRD